LKRDNRVLLLSLCVVLLTSGCAGITHFHTKPTVSAHGLGTTEIQKAAQDTLNQWMAYQSALSNRSVARNSMPVVLVPLAAMATYRGITTTTDAGRRLVLKMGLAGATMFGIGNITLSGPRDAIYAEGMRALACTYSAISPFLQPTKNLSDFSTYVGMLRGNLERVQAARHALAGEVDAQLRWIPDHELVREANNELRKAERLRDQAMRVHRMGQRVLAQSGSIAGAVSTKLLEIQSIVSVQLEKAEPDPALIMKAIDGLLTVGAQIAHVPSLTGKISVPGGEAGAPQDAGADQAALAKQRLREAYRTLEREVDALVMNMAMVSELGGEILRNQKESSPLGKCVVATVASGFSVSPGDAELQLALGQMRSFVVRAGVGRPHVRDLGPHHQSEGSPIKIEEERDIGELAFKVTYVKKIAGIEDAQLLFSDGAARDPATKTVTLKLVDAPADAQKPAPKVPPSGAKPGVPSPKVSPVAAPKPVVKPAPKDGPKPAEPAPAAAKVPPVAPPKPVEKPVIKEEVKPVEAPPAPTTTLGPNAPRNAFEASLKVEDIKAIQKGLKVPESGVLDDATRRAIGRRPGVGVDGRELSADVVKFLQ